MKWKIYKDDPHWLEVIDAVADADDDSYTRAQAEGGTAAVGKWDGCVHFVLSGDYLHICDINDAIERLTELRDMMKARGFEV